ncbi:hypothetical protein [Photobacterium sp. OFAV2-7]|uniref:hypothetical protein n=1 Tax=Photobacterium sp. OFAV2-7 TaxID=2917748 RepID=UPI001EF5E3C7|nr:hypothetical protein [Photobacterium sp. OFAV2-7]MCG7584576.1 hypothetical protein [Photobacterium sp. OFAV2-7]
MSISKLPLIVLLALSTQLQAGANGKHSHPKPEPETLPILLENNFTGTVVFRDELGSKELITVKIKNGKAVFRLRVFPHTSFDGGIASLLNLNVGKTVSIQLDCFGSIDGKNFIVKKRNGVQIRTIYFHPNDFEMCSINSVIEN